MCTCGASEAKRHAAQHATRIFTAHVNLSASAFFFLLYVVSPHQLRSASTVLAHGDSSLLWCLAQHWSPVFFVMPLGCVDGFGSVHRQRANSYVSFGLASIVEHHRFSFRLQFRSRSLARAPCQQEHSDKKHAVCVFKGGKSIGGDDQLLSGMNTNLRLVLDVVTILLTVAGESFLPPEALRQQSCCVSPHMWEQTLVMTISCCLAWTPLCICVRRRCPTLLTVVRKSYWPTETI